MTNEMLFTAHKLNPAGFEKAVAIGAAFDGLLRTLEQTIGGTNREFALVKTHLETACFYAKRSMAMNPTNQE